MSCAFHIVTQGHLRFLSQERTVLAFPRCAQGFGVNVRLVFLSTHRPFFFYDVFKVDR